MASFSSNNPFRRKAPAGSAPPAPPPDLPPFDELDTPPNPTPESAPALPPADRFRNELQTLSTSNQPPPATSFQKPKVVKRVRVQSPPPSSPESPDASVRFPPVGLDDDESSSSSSSDETDEQNDPFARASAAGSADVSDREDGAQPVPVHRPPPNPFQKTLRDLGPGVVEPGERPASAPGTRTALDVGAFGRLLLTGQTGTAPSTQHKSPLVPGNDGTGVADISPPSRQPIFDTLHVVRDTPQTSVETSEVDDERRGIVTKSQTSLQPAPTIVKKKPPPPSSRHGKLIKPDGAEPPLSSPTRRAATLPFASPSRKSPPTSSDLHKPLPAPPQRSPREKDAESVFDREAAGKVPELEIQPGLNIIMPASAPSASQASISAPSSTPQPTKKPVPPPRRQPHGRSESRTTSSAASLLTQQDDTDTSLRRSSFDSTRSRSSSLRVSVHAPAPPPPRRATQQPPRNVGSAMPISPPLSTGDVAAAAAAAEPSPLTVSHALSASPGPIGDTVLSPPPTIPPTAAAAVPTIVPTAAAAAVPTIAPTTGTPGPTGTTGTTGPTGTPGPTATTWTVPTTTGKLLPPPPPPARNASVRGKRPLSTAGVLSPLATAAADGASPLLLSRKLSSGASGNGGGPPPPVPRHRERAVSHDGVAAGVGSGKGEEAGGVVERGEGAGGLLADLSALQREVDALRGRVAR